MVLVVRRVTKPSQDSESDDLPPGEDYDNLEHMFGDNEDVNVVENLNYCAICALSDIIVHTAAGSYVTQHQEGVAFTEDYGMPDEYDRLVYSDHESAAGPNRNSKTKLLRN